MSAMNKEVAVEELPARIRAHEGKYNGTSEEEVLEMEGVDIARIERVYQ